MRGGWDKASLLLSWVGDGTGAYATKQKLVFFHLIFHLSSWENEHEDRIRVILEIQGSDQIQSHYQVTLEMTQEDNTTASPLNNLKKSIHIFETISCTKINLF